jgi:hypothetical protein
MLIYYLYKHFNEKGIHDFLVNKLYSCKEEEL